MSESQICQKCGIPRPIEQFQLMKPKDSKPYRLKTCNKCRHCISEVEGHDINLVRVLLQHSSIAVTQRYIGIQSEEIEEALQNHIHLI